MSPSTRATEVLVLVALLLGVGLRVAAVCATDVFPTVDNTWDSHFYHETAMALAGGEGYTFQGKPTAYYPPAFPAALSLAYRALGASPRAGQLLNVVFSLALLAAVSWLVRILAGARAGWLAAGLLALEPSQIVMPAFLMSEPLCGAAIAGALALLARHARSGSTLRLAGAVFLGAVAGLSRGHAFLVLPAGVLALWGWRGFDRRRAWWAAAAVIGGTAVVLCLWAARNERALGKPVPVATNSGINLLLGNNPNARGARADPPGGVPQTGDEVRDEEIAVERALRYMREEPLRVALLLPVKALRLLGPAPAVTYRAELSEKWGNGVALPVLVLAQAAHTALFLLAGLFLFRAQRAGRDGGERALARVVGFVFVAWTLGHLPFLGGARYLFPVHALLAAAAAAFLTRRSRLSESAP